MGVLCEGVGGGIAAGCGLWNDCRSDCGVALFESYRKVRKQVKVDSR